MMALSLGIIRTAEFVLFATGMFIFSQAGSEITAVPAAAGAPT